MSDSPTPETESTIVCACEEWMRDACYGEASYQIPEGKRYCVFHFPGKQKSADFVEALERKLKNKDFNFRGVWFPDSVAFLKFDFDGDVSFSSATFSEVANFSGATFRAALRSTPKRTIDTKKHPSFAT